ncbi:hypothetical protein TL16_g12498 [Triparma laevis f. inornata]|uniref:Uncharacterized protein n=1 Tax=Triparma laevis f. inornata TaxID=1714386 RepID=A0A9W7EX19_9STRA|nr:hypothetical protein TL16_g12498 [Triparma laevis f. inornata]
MTYSGFGFETCSACEGESISNPESVVCHPCPEGTFVEIINEAGEGVCVTQCQSDIFKYQDLNCDEGVIDAATGEVSCSSECQTILDRMSGKGVGRSCAFRSFDWGSDLDFFSDQNSFDYNIANNEDSACRSVLLPSHETHSFDFRGCVDGEPIQDSALGVLATSTPLTAAAMNGAKCSIDGVTLDGNDDYINIDMWKWGASTSFEIYFMDEQESMSKESQLFYFRSYDDASGFYLSTLEGWGFDHFNEGDGYEKAYLLPNATTSKTERREQLVNQGSWTHLVGTVSDNTMKLYKDGVLQSTVMDTEVMDLEIAKDFEATVETYESSGTGRKLTSAGDLSIFEPGLYQRRLTDFTCPAGKEIQVHQQTYAPTLAPTQTPTMATSPPTQVPTTLSPTASPTPSEVCFNFITRDTYGDGFEATDDGASGAVVITNSATGAVAFNSSGPVDGCKHSETAGSNGVAWCQREEPSVCFPCGDYAITYTGGAESEVTSLLTDAVTEEIVYNTSFLGGNATAGSFQPCGGGRRLESEARRLTEGPNHVWDFRECTTGSPVQDSIGGSLAANPMNGPICSSDGIELDGLDDYVDIEDWEWGGTTSIESYIKFNTVQDSNIFDFSSGDEGWSLAINVNPSDGNNMGFGSSSWSGSSPLGTYANALTHDYVSTSAYSKKSNYVAIVRHAVGSSVCQAVKVFKWNTEGQTFSQHMSVLTHDNDAAQATLTSSDVPSDLQDITLDPIFGNGGDLQVNYWYGNNGVRMVLTGAFGYPDTANSANSDDIHGLGNEMGANTENLEGNATYWHDVAQRYNADCGGESCPVMGTDSGPAWSTPGSISYQYAIYTSETASEFVCEGESLATEIVTADDRFALGSQEDAIQALSPYAYFKRGTLSSGGPSAPTGQLHDSTGVRIRDGSDSSPTFTSEGVVSGRIEVLPAGEAVWGTIRDVGWDDTDALVACKQIGNELGFETISGTALTYGDTPARSGTGNFWWEAVACSGSELKLEECPHEATSFLEHWPDIGITCKFNVVTTTWPDSSSHEHSDATCSGCTVVSSSGNGLIQPRSVLSGGTSTVVNFGDVLPDGHTICSATRYSGASRERILQGGSSNWLHGHWSGQAGVAHFGNWLSGSSSRVTPVTDWVMMCSIGGTDGDSENVMSISTTQDVEFTILAETSTTPSLTVNSGSFPGSWETLEEGSVQFSDRTYTLSDIPDQFIGKKYFKGPCHSNIVDLTVTGGSFIILASLGISEASRDSISISPEPTANEKYTSMRTTSFSGTTGFESWSTIPNKPMVVNGQEYTVSGGDNNTPGELRVNSGSHSSETSDFEISDVVIFDRELSAEEMKTVTSQFYSMKAATIQASLEQASSSANLFASNFESSTWAHVVVTVSANAVNLYKNGVLKASQSSAMPEVLTRSQHWLGRSALSSIGNFSGTIGYVKIWHNVELQQSDVTDLYAPHNTAHHFWDFRNCTTGSPVTDSITGELVATPINPEQIVRNPAEAARSYSSVWNDDAVGTGHALSMLDSAQAWTGNAAGDWAQLDLGSVKTVSAVVTQARAANTQRVTKYTVKVSSDGSLWTDVDGGAEFNGPMESNDADEKITAMFDAPVEARYVRVVVVSFLEYVSLRFGVASPAAGPACSDYGIALDGNDDYIDIDDWTWGGTTSFEAYVKHDSFSNNSPVFDFSNGAGDSSIYLYNAGTSSTIGCNVYAGPAGKAFETTSSFDVSPHWTHVVVTISGTTMKIYKNGILVGTNTDLHEPNVFTRTQHWLGRSASSSFGHFDGTIAYLKVWHGMELSATEVHDMYAPLSPYCLVCKFGTYSTNDDNQRCTPCPAGRYSTDPTSSLCDGDMLNGIEPATTSRFHSLGGSLDSSTTKSNFMGKIAYFRIWNSQELSEDVVKELYGHASPPKAVSSELKSIAEHELKFVVKIDRNGTCYCMAVEQDDPDTLPPFPTRTSIKSNAAPIPLTANMEAELLFGGLKSSTTFTIFCLYDSLPSPIDGSILSSAVYAEVSKAETSIGIMIPYENECDRQLGNTHATLNLAARHHAGKVWVLFLKTPVLAAPSANGVKVFGTQIPSLSTDGSGNEWLHDASSESYSAPTSVCVTDAGKKAFFVTHTQENLLPMTDYQVFMYTEDEESPAETMSQIYIDLQYETPRIVTTACCGFITVGEDMVALPSDSVMRFQSYRYKERSMMPIYFDVSHVPSDSVTITVSAKSYKTDSGEACSIAGSVGKSLDDVSSDSMSPSTFIIDSTAESTRSSFMTSFTKSGCVILSFAISGPSSNQYDTSDSKTSVFVLSAGAEPTPPSLLSAQFSNNAKSIYINFNSPTNRGDKGGAEFPCSDLFTFDSDPSAPCMFLSTTQMLAILSKSSTTMIGSKVDLIAGKMFAECSDPDAFDCSSWTAAPVSSTTVDGPATPFYPAPSLTGATTVSSCADIDVSAMSSSGSGGRKWTAFQWSFTSTASNTTRITTYMEDLNNELAAIVESPTTTMSNFNKYLELSVPTVNLIKGGTYIFMLTLKNFFDNSASSAPIAVTVSSNSVPSIMIQGGDKRSMLRPNSLSIFAEAFGAACPGEQAKIVPAKNYNWLIKDVAGAVQDFPSVSIDRRFFKLNSFTLIPDSTYFVEVTVTDSDGLTASSSVEVTVGVSALVAIIEGGSKVVAPKSKGVLLSSSSSYDPDAYTNPNNDNTETYIWTCVETAPIYGAACAGLDLPESMELPFDEAMMNTLLGDEKAKTLSFSVAYVKDNRKATGDTYLQIESSEPPQVEIGPIWIPKINPSNKLQLKGFISPDSRYPVHARWELATEGSFILESGGFTNSLGDVSASATSTVLATGRGSAQQFFLIFPENSFIGGVSYTFKLIAEFDNPSAKPGEGVGFAEISLLVNSPPIAGTLTIDNGEGENSGDALQTLFSVTAYDFTDDPTDLPLAYSYLFTIGLREWGGAETIISAGSLSSKIADVILPSGGGNQSVVEVFTRVFDIYGSSSEANVEAFVTTPKLTTAELANLTQGLSDAAIAKGDTSGVFQVLSSSSSILNNLNCSFAPSCVALNRAECSTGDTPHTCGKCVDGYTSSDDLKLEKCSVPPAHCLNGVVDGDESDVDCGGSCFPCVNDKFCKTDEDCSLSFCEDGVCSPPLMKCPGDALPCTGQGECKAYALNLNEIERKLCKQGGMCKVACTCDEGFFGKACDRDESAQLELMESRKNMLGTLSTVTTMQDASPDAMSQQASSVSSLVGNPDELDDDAKDAATGVMTGVSEGLLGNGGVDKNTAKNLGGSVSSLMTPNLNGTNTTANATAGFTGMSDVVDNLMNAQALGQFVGEKAAELVTDNLKTAISKVGVANTAGAAFSTPADAAARENGYKSPEVGFPVMGGGVAEFFPEGCAVGITVAELGAHDRGGGGEKNESVGALDSSVTRFGMGCFRSDGGARRRTKRERSLYRRLNAADSDDDGSASKITIVIPNAGTAGILVEDEELALDLVNGTNSSALNTTNITDTNITDAKWVYLTCDWDQQGNVTGYCSADHIITKKCTGVRREYTIPCIKGEVVEKKACAVSGGRRHLMETSGNEEAGEAGNIDMGGLVSGAFATYAATFALLATLSLDDVLKNLFVFFVMGGALTLSALCCIYGVWKDKKDRKEVEEEAEIKARMTENMKTDERKSQLIQESQPTFAQMASQKWQYAKKQLAAKHEYAEVIFEFSPTQSRPQRIALLITAFLGLLFIQALLYEFAYPDSIPKCETWLTKEECLVPRNLWNTTQARCLWSVDTQTCSFIEPEISATGTIIMSIFAVIISSPFCLMIAIIFNSAVFPPVTHHGGATGDAVLTEPDRASELAPKSGLASQDGEGDDEEEGGGRVRKRDLLIGHVLEVTNIQAQLDRLDNFKKTRNLKKKVKQKLKDILAGVTEKLEALEISEHQLLALKRGQVSGGHFFDQDDQEELEKVQEAMIRIRGKFFAGNFFHKVVGVDSKTKLYKQLYKNMKLADAIEEEFEELNDSQKEIRMIEYSRMMHLSAFEQKVYFQNRIEFDDDAMTPIHCCKKIFGWFAIICYCLITAMYICLFGVMKGQQTTKAWLLSFMVGDLQDIFIFIPLKIMLLNVYLPQLIGRHVAENSATNQRKHWFARFFHENAIVYVAENHPELQASELALRAFTFDYESGSKLKDGAAPSDGNFSLNRNKSKKNLKAGRNAKAKGSRRQKRQTIWDPIKKGEFGNDIVEDTYKYEGCRKVGMIAFTIFLMLPESAQMTILDTVIPTLIGSIVYGNIQVYQTKKQAWMLPAMDMGGIAFLIFLGWAYFKRRAWKRAKVEKEAQMMKDAELLQQQHQQQGGSTTAGVELSVMKFQKRQTAVLGGRDVGNLGQILEEEKKPAKKSSKPSKFTLNRKDSGGVGGEGGGGLQNPMHKLGMRENSKGLLTVKKPTAETDAPKPKLLSRVESFKEKEPKLKEPKEEPKEPAVPLPLLDLKKAVAAAGTTKKVEVLRRPSGDDTDALGGAGSAPASPRLAGRDMGGRGGRPGRALGGRAGRGGRSGRGLGGREGRGGQSVMDMFDLADSEDNNNNNI